MSIICTKCGSTNISTAMINHNSQEVKGLIDEPSLYGWCEDCKALIITTNVEDTKKIIGINSINSSTETVSNHITRDVESCGKTRTIIMM